MIPLDGESESGLARLSGFGFMLGVIEFKNWFSPISKLDLLQIFAMNKMFSVV